MNENIKKTGNDFEVVKKKTKENELGYQQGKDSFIKIIEWCIIGFGIFILGYIAYSIYTLINMYSGNYE